MYHTPVWTLGGVGSKASREGYIFAILGKICPQITHSLLNNDHARLALVATPPKVYTGV